MVNQKKLFSDSSLSLNDFFSTNSDFLVEGFAENNPAMYEKIGAEKALKQFHQMAERVPAYRDFLKKNKINHHKIKKIDDLKHVPWVDKENYLKKYKLSDLCWDGKMKAPIISASSGSSGQPFFWPRSFNVEAETSYLYEFFIKHILGANKRKTLFINGFSMGIYIGGTFTLNCCMRLAQKGLPLTIITPGINQEEILRIVEKMGGEFEQIIIGGYPPFVRDIVDEGERRGIDWKSKVIKFVFASESLSETLRSYIYEKVGIKKSNYYTSSVNLYGTADAALMGHEVPLSILLRKAVGNNAELCKKIFGEGYAPSLNQYYPFFKYIQIENDELIFSSFNTEIPLLKYNIHDRGNILSYEKMIELLKAGGYDIKKVRELVGGQLMWHLPFVYLYGRSDFTVTLYGLNIYPENIKMALETKELSKLCTGKFVMETVNLKKDQQQRLLIHIELQTNIKPDKAMEGFIQKIIIETLRKKNSEYNHLFQTIKMKAHPELDLRLKGDTAYFAAATKQRWVKKT
ncbi:MAG: phenylacetate--CoA ligase family protein [Patescibacteria group bacterium]|jgi:phenylacetate-CoA ligase